MFRSKLVYAMIGIVSLLLVIGNAPTVSAAPDQDQRLTPAQQVEAEQVTRILDHAINADGTLDRAAALDVAPASVVEDFQTGFDQGAVTAKSCKGVNKASSHWYGVRGDLSSCVAANVATAGGTFSVIAGVVAAAVSLPKTAKKVTAITMALVAAGTFALNECRKAGNGVRVYYMSTVTNIPWCKSQ